jgi:hypothetical protein
MPQENLVAVQFTAEEKTTIENAIRALQEKLAPKLITLKVEDRKELPKMSDRTTPFVEKALNDAVSNPDFAPKYLNVDDLKIDVEAVKTLTQFANSLLQIATALDDTIMLSGSEAYTAALSYYNNVKQATKNNIAAAKPIYADLSTASPDVQLKRLNKPNKNLSARRKTCDSGFTPDFYYTSVHRISSGKIYGCQDILY